VILLAKMKKNEESGEKKWKESDEPKKKTLNQ
jgi:hypothetical protein